jgi:gliding motility-associated protein GldM
MAGGGKQTPRQKMINLMYLVLTAMLALQVSSSIMDKFVFLNASLEHSRDEAEKASQEALVALKKMVEKAGSSREGLESVKRADKLIKTSQELIKYIETVKRNLGETAGEGFDPKTKTVHNPKEETKVEVYMIGTESKKGEGYTVEKKLNEYVDWLYEEFKDLGFEKPKDRDKMETEGPFPLLAYGNKNSLLYQNDAVQRGKGFVEASFGQTPVVAALAILTQKQNEIIRYEQEVLKKLGAGDLSRDIKFDQIIVKASATSQTVAIGQEYEAEMFITATSSKISPSMTVNGSGIPVKDGVGKVRIPATSAGEKSWSGTVTFKNKGRDTTFPFKEKYMVVEPVLIVKAAANFPLYRNCANPLETAVPALGATYSPSFSVTNGSAVPGGKQGNVTIFPGAGPETVLTVSSGGKVMGSAKFRVNPVPPPQVFLGNRSGNPIANLDQPIAVPSSLQIVAKPDETFANTLPTEANYGVMGVEVTQFRGGRSIAQRKFGNGIIEMGGFQTRPGDGFQVKIVSVQRINSRGEREQAKITSPYIGFFVR